MDNVGQRNQIVRADRRPCSTALLVRGAQRTAAMVVASLALMLAGVSAGANAAELDLKIIIAHLSDTPGEIDSRAARLHRELQGQFRYRSISVISSSSHKHAVDEAARGKLPNGRTLMVKPILIESKSALISVDVPGLVQTDMRLKSDQLAIIGTEKYKDGKLVIVLEPHL